MKISKLFLALMVLITLACLSTVQGQYASSNTYQPSTSMPSSTSPATPLNEQFYTMPVGQNQAAHISAPVSVDVLGKTPENLYYGNQNQMVPYSLFNSNLANMKTISMWIQGITDWTQIATVPQGAVVSLITVSSTGGSGYLNEIHPDGTAYRSNFYFYPYSTLSFYADTIGRHVLSFGLNGQVSNTVIIDVTGNYVPPTNYYMPPAYYSDYNYGNFPGFVGFDNSGVGSVSSGNRETGGSGDTGGRVDTGGSGDNTGSRETGGSGETSSRGN